VDFRLTEHRYLPALEKWSFASADGTPQVFRTTMVDMANKRSSMLLGLVFAILPMGFVAMAGGTNAYPWLEGRAAKRCIARDIQCPDGFARTVVKTGSFADWLRNLPLKESGAKILNFDGSVKPNQLFHAAVIDIDTGRKNLQQCADAVIRLRAEYLTFTNGNPAPFSRWRAGYRPSLSGNIVRWERSDKPDTSHRNFRAYLDTVFMYAGTASLSRELEAVRDIGQIQIGDVFIHGGAPGHAVIVLDMAVNKKGEKAFMVGQSFMPAQDMHVLRNLHLPSLAPWYEIGSGERIQTPEWEFASSELKRFKNP
jgi:Domain of unknown function (4846)